MGLDRRRCLCGRGTRDAGMGHLETPDTLFFAASRDGPGEAETIATNERGQPVTSEQGPDQAGRAEEQPDRGDLRNAGDLVQQGGLSGSIMILLYIVIGIGFWSLVGYGLDRLLGTHWIVWLGAGIGAFAGFYLVYLHMRPRDDDSSFH